MKPILTSVLLMALAALTMAQDASRGSRTPSGAVIEGIVVRDPGGDPVKKALIELIAANQNQGGNYTATTSADGRFQIEGIVAGRYHLFAERTGLLDVDRHRFRGEGRVLTISPGQEMKDLVVRLQAAAVVRGRVTDEDGDVLPDAQVTVLRQSYKSGHVQWEQVGGERTNDLGEFRIPNLPSGNYYLSVNPPPDFRSLIEEGGAAAGKHAAEPVPATTYQTTYYPGTTDRSSAAPIQLHAGEEFPANFSLTPSPRLSIRGSVVNLPPHTSASIVLQSRDFGLILNGAEMHKDGSFVIRDVSPGSYTILATVENAAIPMIAREYLQVANSIDGLRLSPQPGATVRGHLRVEGKAGVVRAAMSDVFLALESGDASDDSAGFAMGGGFSNITRVASDGTFEWKEVPPGNYYVQIIGNTDTTQDWFVKSLSAGNGEGKNAEVAVNGGTMSLDLLASDQGAIVDGVVTDPKGEAVANALVVAVPETRWRDRGDHYRKTVTDQSGHFTLRGILPGDYTVFAWESLDGEAYYNPDFLKSYEGQGTPLKAKEADRDSLSLRVIPNSEAQQ